MGYEDQQRWKEKLRSERLGWVILIFFILQVFFLIFFAIDEKTISTIVGITSMVWLFFGLLRLIP